MASRIPDLVVSVDFGMTCTGVAYQNLSLATETIQWIQKFPGRMQAAENKVPTSLVYSADFPFGAPTSWGFQTEEASELFDSSKIHREWFKILLDPAKLLEEQAKDPLNTPRSVDEVKKYFTDYLHKLYETVEYRLHSLPSTPWGEAYVEYIFSVPTTWTPPIVENFREVIEASGFGRHVNHSVIIDLTEAEAAAVFSSRETPGLFRSRDILLVCDAGGGTTDLSVLRVLNTSGQSLRLEQLDVVQGQSIGSTAIDRDFKDLASRRLADADCQSTLGIDIQTAAWEMMKSNEFQNVKCEMGSPDEPPWFKLAVRGLRSDYKDMISGIDAGFMKFTREDLQKLFDTQIHKVCLLLNDQLQTIQNKYPHERIAHLVLSGGLGNSGYVYQKLSAIYMDPNSPWPCARGMEVRTSPDPQLAVCKGMIVSRIQKLRSTKSPIGIRCCRASYGSVCKELYDPHYAPHANIPSQTDPLNGKEYVVDVVEWYIKKGEPIDVDTPMSRQYKRRVPLGNRELEIETTLVTSNLEAHQLPYRLSGDVYHICDLHATIPSSEGVIHKENRFKVWKKSRSYMRIDFEIKFIIGPADLRFELWREGRKMSGERSIKVDFASHEDYTTAPPFPPPRENIPPLTLHTLSERYTTRQSYMPQGADGLIPVTDVERRNSQYYNTSDVERRRSHYYNATYNVNGPYSTNGPYIHEIDSDPNIPNPNLKIRHQANGSTSSSPPVIVSPVESRPITTRTIYK